MLNFFLYFSLSMYIFHDQQKTKENVPICKKIKKKPGEKYILDNFFSQKWWANV